MEMICDQIQNVKRFEQIMLGCDLRKYFQDVLMIWLNRSLREFMRFFIFIFRLVISEWDQQQCGIYNILSGLTIEGGMIKIMASSLIV